MTCQAIESSPGSTGRRLRIAIWHNLPSGGGKRALHDHVRGLVGRGHTVESWCPDTADPTYLPLSEIIPEHTVPLKAELERQADLAQRGPFGRALSPYSGSRRQLAAMDAMARRCAQEIDDAGFDLAFLNTCMLQYAPAVAQHLRTPTILYLQEPNRHIYEARPAANSLPALPWVAEPDPTRGMGPGLMARKREAGRLAHQLSQTLGIRLQAGAELRNARACGRILCNSLFSRESILRCYGLESEVCYLGIDTSSFQAAEGPKRPYAIGLGSFMHSKGIDRALEGLATIDAGQRPELVWVGNLSSDGYLDLMRGRAAALGVRLTPRQMVSQSELVELLGQASVLVYTSRLEPFGYAPLEANACGTVVVGIAEGGIRETVRTGANGTLVSPGDPEALGRAIAAYTSDPGLARADGKRAREHVLAEWRVEAAIDRLERALLGLAADATAPRGAPQPTRRRP